MARKAGVYLIGSTDEGKLLLNHGRGLRTMPALMERSAFKRMAQSCACQSGCGEEVSGNNAVGTGDDAAALPPH